MAVDYQVSAPCLLDDLMDDEIIKCDFDFGSVTELGGFAAKGSPSHESDSGCSDMSEERSVSPSQDGDVLDFQSLDFFGDDTDNELASYFATPLTKLQRNEVSECSFVSEESTRPNVMTIKPSVMDDLCLSPEIDSDLNDPEYDPMPCRVVHTKRKNVASKKGKSSVVNGIAKTEICVLPASSISVKSIDGNNNRTPAVKVVKVIKAPALSTNQEIGDQLMLALDDRNKKNALQAKINREKKKAYIKELQEEIDTLKTENYAFKETNRKILKERNALEGEVEYLRSVLANDSALSGLLKNIGNVKNLKLSSSFSRKRSAEHDHDYGSSSKRVKAMRSTAGVCLHVDDGNISLEFCSKCASMAKSSNGGDDS